MDPFLLMVAAVAGSRDRARSVRVRHHLRARPNRRGTRYPLLAEEVNR
jgi:hypothetical protein